MKRLFDFESNHKPEIDEKFHQLNIGNIGNVIYWWKFFEIIKNISGDIVECGIGRGRSLLVISAINQLLDKNEGGERIIYAYDSFEGFPEPTDEDKSARNPKKGEWSYSPSGKYKYSEDFIKLVLTEANISFKDNQLELKKGFFGDSLKNHPDRPIALLHVDGDLYQSYMDVLKLAYHKVVPGGLIVFDDFLSNNKESERWPGALIAVKDFLGEDYKKIIASERGTYFFIKE